MNAERVKVIIQVTIRDSESWGCSSLEDGAEEIVLVLPVAMLDVFSPDPILNKLIDQALKDYVENNRDDENEPIPPEQ